MYKIIFAGPSGAGKSTAIQALSHCEPIKTEVRSTDGLEQHKDKASITVAFDYGYIDLNEKERIHLYGTPGQSRFDYMWPIIAQGALGVVMLIDNSRPDPIQDLKNFVQLFRHLIQTTQLVVGITCMDLKNSPALADYHEILALEGIRAPVFEVDARRQDDLEVLLQALLYSLEPHLNCPKTVSTQALPFPAQNARGEVHYVTA